MKNENKLTQQDYINIINLKKLLKEKFGDLIQQIYCFGSRVYAQKEDADFDILVVTKTRINWRKRDKIFEIIFKFELENELFFDAKFFSKEDFDIIHKEMPFIKSVKSYGIKV
jgi:predicted nucleotidyltransferase